MAKRSEILNALDALWKEAHEARRAYVDHDDAALLANIRRADRVIRTILKHLEGETKCRTKP